MVSAEGGGRGCGVHGLQRVGFVHDARPRREVCVLSCAPLEAFADKALGRQVVDVQKRRRRAVHTAMLADGVGHAVTLRLGDLRVRHVVHLLISGLDSIEEIENFLSLLSSPAVGECPKENGLLGGYGGVRKEFTDVVGHVNGSCVVPMKLVDGIENKLQPIATVEGQKVDTVGVAVLDHGNQSQQAGLISLLVGVVVIGLTIFVTSNSLLGSIATSM